MIDEKRLAALEAWAQSDALTGHGTRDEFADLIAEVRRLNKALLDIATALGPACKDNTCSGCASEMDEARELASKALGI